jgi:hypothetical protein
MQTTLPALQRVYDTIKHPREGSLLLRQRTHKPVIALGFLIVLRSRWELRQQTRCSSELAPKLRGADQRWMQDVPRAIVEPVATTARERALDDV